MVSKINLSNTKQAIDDLASGKMVVLLDDESRENEGDLIIPSKYATPEVINFMATYGRGLICVTLTGDDFDRLDIPMMTSNNSAPLKTAFGVSFEAAKGVTTGISAFDRAASIAAAINPESGPEDITQPGHMFPLRICEGGVLSRNGHTEGASDLSRLAGCGDSAVLCEIMRDDGHMARLPDILSFAEKHKITVTTIKDLVDYRLSNEEIYKPGPSALLPIDGCGNFRVQSFNSDRDKKDHLAIISEKTDLSQPCLVRVHSECLTGDALGSTRCDCAAQLQKSKEVIAQEGGILLYLRQEGRGIGLAEKIKAYALQDNGMDTVEANEHLGHGRDERDYGIAAQMLKSLGVKQVSLMTNNPHKINRLIDLGVNIKERVPLEIEPSSHNAEYLKVKKSKLGHLLSLRSEENV